MTAMLGVAQKVTVPSGVGGPCDKCHVRLDAFEPRLHSSHEVFHPAVRPVLIFPKFDVVEVGVGDFRTCVGSIILPTVLAVADAAVMQTVEAEGIDVRKFCQDFRQHVDEEIAIWSEQAQHSAVRKLYHIRLRNLRRVRRNASPVRNSNLSKRLLVKRLGQNLPIPDRRRCLCA